MKRNLILVVAGTCCVPALAFAHALLLQATPADHASLAQAPPEALLRFNEPVEAISSRVLTRDGRNIAQSSEVVDNTLRIVLPRDMPNGPYIVSFRVLSADSHPVAGSIIFSVGTLDETDEEWSQSLQTIPRPIPEAVLALNRALYLAALFFALGATLFLIAIDGSTRSSAWLRPWIIKASLLAAATAIAGIGLHGMDLAGTDLSSLATSATWNLAMQSTRGHVLLLSLAGLLLVTAATRFGGAVRAGMIGLGTLVIASCFVLSGHGATAGPRWLSVPAWSVHVVAASFWVGSFIPLLLVLNKASTTRRLVLYRFSRAAIVAVACLLAAGIAMACMNLHTVSALTGTLYGEILCAKLALVVMLLALAAYNRWYLMPRLAASGPNVKRALRNSIRSELVIGLAILLVTAFLSHQEPQDVMAAQSTGVVAESFTAKATSGDYTVEIAVAPARAGKNGIALRLLHQGLHPLEPYEVKVAFSKPDAGVEPWERVMKLEKDSTFVVDGEQLPLNGEWVIRVDALLTEFVKETFTVRVRIR